MATAAAFETVARAPRTNGGGDRLNDGKSSGKELRPRWTIPWKIAGTRRT